MPPEIALRPPAELAVAGRWHAALARLVAVWLALALLTARDWRAMAHQWWNIDTYNHVLLVPAILVWLVWLRRSELRKLDPSGWWPALAWLVASLSIWLIGRAMDANLIAQAGLIGAFQGGAMAIIGLRASLALAFPLAYALFLVPFGDELIPALQSVTARIAIALTTLSGVPAVIDGLFIDTPAGRFVVAEECSGVKFLIAMIALSVLAGWTGFSTWRARITLVVGAAMLSIVANGVRAWGTIFVAQYVGIERAGGFDHIVYGWVFFAVVIAAVLGAAWRYFDRVPEDSGLTATEVAALPLVTLERHSLPPISAVISVFAIALVFAVLAALV